MNFGDGAGRCGPSPFPISQNSATHPAEGNGFGRLGFVDPSRTSTARRVAHERKQKRNFPAESPSLQPIAALFVAMSGADARQLVEEDSVSDSDSVSAGEAHKSSDAGPPKRCGSPLGFGGKGKKERRRAFPQRRDGERPAPSLRSAGANNEAGGAAGGRASA